MTEKLLPCPFCGGEAKLVIAIGQPKSSFVDCQSCEMSTNNHRAESESTAAWNRRAAPVAAQSSVPGWKLGSLLTVNKDEYPALGSFFAQIWEDDEVVARVYGNDRDQVLSRANTLLHTPPAARQTFPFGLKPSDFPPLPECCDAGPRCGNAVCDAAGGQAQPMDTSAAPVDITYGHKAQQDADTKERIKALEDALQPFAADAAEWGHVTGAHRPMFFQLAGHPDQAKFTVADLRRAAALLGES